MVVGPRRIGLGAQPPVTDNVVILKVCNLMKFYLISYLNYVATISGYSMTNVSDAFSKYKDI